MSTGFDRPACEAQRPRLGEFYWRWFSEVPANTDELRRESFRLRYQVYCVENPFEDPADNPEEMESDAYDAHAVHTNLVHVPSGVTAGTVRLVLPVAERLSNCFAIQRVCQDPLIRDAKRFPVPRMGEISRFSVSKRFRQRRGDALYPRFEEPEPENLAAQERRVIPNMTLGLIEGLVRMTVEQRLTYWCAVMEPSLLRLLTRMGIHFEHIGPLVDYHGRRQPCFVRVDRLLERVRAEQPEIWSVLTLDGAHVEALKAIVDAQQAA